MSEILKLSRPADIDALLPYRAEYCAFDGLRYDPDRARRTMLALLDDARLGRACLAPMVSRRTRQ